MDDTISALQAALEVSPDNLPLRRHLADTLASVGRWAGRNRESSVHD